MAKFFIDPGDYTELGL